jgi:hypothetical protein
MSYAEKKKLINSGKKYNVLGFIREFNKEIMVI